MSAQRTKEPRAATGPSRRGVLAALGAALAAAVAARRAAGAGAATPPGLASGHPGPRQAEASDSPPTAAAGERSERELPRWIGHG